MTRKVSDEFGPELVLEFNRPQEGCFGLVVIDNTLLGFSKGGLRITKEVSVDEMCSSARICTYRNALLKIPFGGGRSAVVCDLEELNQKRKRELMRSFARVLKSTLKKKYIVEPDLNTGSEEMKTIAEELGCWSACAGKPRDYFTKGGRKAGIPHDPEITALGLFHVAIAATSQLNIPLKDMKVLTVGLGEVGTALSSRLSEVGVHTINSLGSEDKRGIEEDRTVGISDVLKSRVDLAVIGCRRTWTLAERISEELNDGLVIEGEDLALGHGLRERLSERGIVVLPDLVSNCGGTITSFCELRGIKPALVPLMIEKRAVRSVIEVLGRAELQDITPTEAAVQLAENELRNKKRNMHVVP